MRAAAKNFNVLVCILTKEHMTVWLISRKHLAIRRNQEYEQKKIELMAQGSHTGRRDTFITQEVGSVLQ